MDEYVLRFKDDIIYKQVLLIKTLEFYRVLKAIEVLSKIGGII